MALGADLQQPLCLTSITVNRIVSHVGQLVQLNNINKNVFNDTLSGWSPLVATQREHCFDGRLAGIEYTVSTEAA